MAAKYIIRLMFEWGGGNLWCGTDVARATFDVGPIEDRLPLSDALRRELDELGAWHDTSLNREYPPDPGPWADEERARFEAAAMLVLERVREDLGPEFQVVYVPL